MWSQQPGVDLFKVSVSDQNKCERQSQHIYCSSQNRLDKNSNLTSETIVKHT